MPKFVAPIKAKDKALPGQDHDSKKMFDLEDVLGDDFLTSWKPNLPSMTVDMDGLVQPPKSFIKKGFATSSMKMDFDFGEGLDKLASFDIDLSFDDPPSRAKKAKKFESPQKLVSDKDDSDIFKGFDTLDLEDTSFKPTATMEDGPEKKTGRSEAGDLPIRVCNSGDSDHEETNTEEMSVKSRQNIKPKTGDAEEVVQRSSPSFQLDLTTHNSAEGKRFVDCYNAALLADREAMKVPTTTNPSADVHDAREPVSSSGQETNDENTMTTKPAVFGEDGNFKDQPPRKLCDSLSDVSGKSALNQDTEDLDAKQPATNNGPLNEVESMRAEHNFNPLPPVPRSLSSTIIRPDKQKSSSRRDSTRNRSLQFDPLSMSSSKSRADVQDHEQFCSQPKNPPNLKCANREVRFESRAAEIETRNEESVPPSLDKWTKSSSQPASARDEENSNLHRVQISSKSSPISSENPENKPEQRKSHQNSNIEESGKLVLMPEVHGFGPDKRRNEAGNESEMSKGTSALMRHRDPLCESIIDNSIPNEVLLRDRDNVQGERTTVKKGDCKELDEPASGLIAANRLDKKRNNIVPIQDQVKPDEDVSKTPLSLPLGSNNRVQRGLPIFSSHPKEKQGESVEDERGSAKKFGQPLGDSFKAKSTRVIAPAEEKRERPQSQISSIQKLGHQNQLSSRPLQISKTLLKSSLGSSDRISPHNPNAVSGKSYSLLSSVTPQKRKPAQLISSTGSKAPAMGPSEVMSIRGKGVRDQEQTSGASKALLGSGSSRSLKERKLMAIEDKGGTSGIPISLTNLPNDQENLIQRKPRFEGLKLKADNVKQREVLPERSSICAKDRLREDFKESGPYAVENKKVVKGNPPSCSYLQSPFQRSTQRKPLPEDAELKAEDVTQRPEAFPPALERSQANLASRGEIQKQIIPASDGTEGVIVSQARSPVDLLIGESDSIIEQSIRHTESLEAMLKAMKKLNGDSKDLMVRALVANNKLLMLNSPIIDDKAMKESVLETLRRHRI